MSQVDWMALYRERLGDRLEQFRLPPPVFTLMQGEFISFDPALSRLSARFPILDAFCNPYGMMQGGMLAAAVDNTLGPLSMLVAPPNVTRRLEMKYSRPAAPAAGWITVEAYLLERRDRQLSFRAEVRDEQGQLIAQAQAVHWILEGG